MKVREILTRWRFKADTGQLKRFEGALRATRRAAGLAAKAVGGLAVAGAGAAVGIAAAIAKTAEADDKIGKLSDRLGVAVEDLSTLGHAAQLSGAEVGDLGMAFKGLSTRAAEAGAGNKEAAKLFQQLGVSVKDATGALKDPITLLYEVSEGLSQVSSEADRVRLANKLFEESGIKLLPMLKAGAVGIAQMQAEARQLGLVLTDAGKAGAAEFNDSLLRATGAVKGIAVQLTRGLMPALTGYLKMAREWVGQNQALISARLSEAVGAVSDALKGLDMRSVAQGATDLARALGVLSRAVVIVGRGLYYVGKAFDAVGVAIGETAARVYLFGENAIAMGARVVATVKATVADIQAWFGRLPGALSAGFDGALESVQAFFNRVYDWIAQIPDRIIAAIKQGFSQAVADARATLGSLGDIVLGPQQLARAAIPQAAAGSVSNRTSSATVNAPVTVNVPAGTPAQVARDVAAAAGRAVQAGGRRAMLEAVAR